MWFDLDPILWPARNVLIALVVTLRRVETTSSAPILSQLHKMSYSDIEKLLAPHVFPIFSSGRHMPSAIATTLQQITFHNIEDAKANAPVFTLFVELPPEIQKLVWAHALPGPRVVEIYREDYTASGTDRVGESSHKLLSGLKLSCKEANVAVMNHYRSILLTAYGVTRFGNDAAILLDSSQDTIFSNGNCVFVLDALFKHAPVGTYPHE